jgi:hypothetical protein
VCVCVCVYIYIIHPPKLLCCKAGKNAAPCISIPVVWAVVNVQADPGGRAV